MEEDLPKELASDNYTVLQINPSDKSECDVLIANTALESIALLRHWANKRQSFTENNSESFAHEFKDISRLVRLSGTRLLKSPDDERQHYFEEVVGLQSQIKEYLQISNPDIQELQLESREEIANIIYELPNVIHDVVNHITAIELSMDILKSPNLSKEERDSMSDLIRNELTIIPTVVESGYNQLKEVYPQTQIPLPQALNILLRSLKSYQNKLKLDYDKSEFEEDVSLTISADWLDRIATNVALNSNKAYEAKNIPDSLKILYISSEETLDGEIEIVFDDKGIGFPPEIIESGFKKDVSSWNTNNNSSNGQGEGMAGLDRQLQKGYGIKVIRENRINKDGTIAGARLRVRFPKPDRVADPI